MATLDVGLDDAFTTIRSALSAAASFAQFGAKALSVVGAGKALTTVVGNARIDVGQLDDNGGVPLDLNLSSIRLQYALASGYILQYGDYLFNWLGYDQGGNLYYGATNTIVGLSLTDLSCRPASAPSPPPRRPCSTASISRSARPWRPGCWPASITTAPASASPPCKTRSRSMRPPTCR
jgi:hypothetical protein